MKTIVVPEPEARDKAQWVIADHQLQSLEEVTAEMIQKFNLKGQ